MSTHDERAAAAGPARHREGDCVTTPWGSTSVGGRSGTWPSLRTRRSTSRRWGASGRPRPRCGTRLSKPDPTWLFAQHPLYNTIVTLDGDSADGVLALPDGDRPASREGRRDRPGLRRGCLRRHVGRTDDRLADHRAQGLYEVEGDAHGSKTRSRAADQPPRARDHPARRPWHRPPRRPRLGRQLRRRRTRFAHASSSSLGEKATLTAATWRGCTQSLPVNPIALDAARSASRAAGSSSRTVTPSTGPGRPAAAEARTRRPRA